MDKYFVQPSLEGWTVRLRQTLNSTPLGREIDREQEHPVSLISHNQIATSKRVLFESTTFLRRILTQKRVYHFTLHTLQELHTHILAGLKTYKYIWCE